MFKVIQFPHPGEEHGADKKSKTHKSWNKGKHRRKFLLSKGNYVERDKLKRGDLIFWGEWEPPSKVEKLDNKDNVLFPTWLHKPYLPDPIPEQSNSETDFSCNTFNKKQPYFQNTDPCVFGENFIYFNCRQHKKESNIKRNIKGRTKTKERTETKLTKLEPGSLILFGSTKGSKKGAFFMLDTVFVIAGSIDYNTNNVKKSIKNFQSKGVSQDYIDAVFKMAFPRSKGSLELRLYLGATYEKPVEGMYSFSPSKIYKNEKSGFKRMELRNSDINCLTDSTRLRLKYSDKNSQQVKEIWEKIKKLSRKKGLVEGVSFEWPEKVQTP